MVKPFSVFLSCTAVVFALATARPVFAALPDYKIGDIATNDVITPVPLSVLNAEATAMLKQRESVRVPMVFRYNPNLVNDSVAALNASFEMARTNFLEAYYQVAVQNPDVEVTPSSPEFKKVLQAAKKRMSHFPLFEQLGPAWLRNQSDETTRMVLARQLREVMGRPVFAASVPGYSSHNSVRVVTVTNLDEALDRDGIEKRGEIIRGEELLRLTDAKNFTKTNLLTQLRNAGGYLSSFVRTNAMPDSQLTARLRAERTDGLAVMDSYETGAIILKRGQQADAKALAALTALREKNTIAVLQTELEAQRATTGSPSAPQEFPRKYLAGILGGFAIVLGFLVVILRRVRTTNSMLPMLVRHEGHVSESEVVWRERALLAEANAEKVKQAMKGGFMHWMRERLVSGLFQQRAQLLSSHQRAAAEMQALDERLEQLHAPLQERIATYEKRIAELERELAVKGEENRELIRAKISLAKLSVERERKRAELATN
ncbi:MAG: hypothetical protein RLY20_1002 [Verrucomicrobiota bacterium]|jgi:hypothetical protein